MDLTPIILAVITGLFSLFSLLIGIWKVKIEAHKDVVQTGTEIRSEIELSEKSFRRRLAAMDVQLQAAEERLSASEDRHVICQQEILKLRNIVFRLERGLSNKRAGRPTGFGVL